jgi:cysteine desulfurase
MPGRTCVAVLSVDSWWKGGGDTLVTIPMYLDHNATTPVDQRVIEVVVRYLGEDFGNAGSRTHAFGSQAAQAVEAARSAVALLAQSRPEEVIFTSGATEANNLALLGLASMGESSGRKHVVTTAIEHKAVLEPLEYLAEHRGFELEVLPATSSGCVDPAVLQRALREDTLLVSTMHANNETGVVLPLDEYADVLNGHPAYWHVDAAQTFGKVAIGPELDRVDMLSVSAHKVYGPKGVGALVARKRGYDPIPLEPLMRGGGQERGLRPGTLPVALIAGFGEAARLARTEMAQRQASCKSIRAEAVAALGRLHYESNGAPDQTLPHVLNLSVPGVDAEAAIMMLRDIAAISNGSACTSSSYEPSHVLSAMGLEPERIAGALRISWSHESSGVDWHQIADQLDLLRT